MSDDTPTQPGGEDRPVSGDRVIARCWLGPLDEYELVDGQLVGATPAGDGGVIEVRRSWSPRRPDWATRREVADRAVPWESVYPWRDDLEFNPDVGLFGGDAAEIVGEAIGRVVETRRIRIEFDVTNGEPWYERTHHLADTDPAMVWDGVTSAVGFALDREWTPSGRFDCDFYGAEVSWVDAGPREVHAGGYFTELAERIRAVLDKQREALDIPPDLLDSPQRGNTPTPWSDRSADPVADERDLIDAIEAGLLDEPEPEPISAAEWSRRYGEAIARGEISAPAEIGQVVWFLDDVSPERGTGDGRAVRLHVAGLVLGMFEGEVTDERALEILAADHDPADAAVQARSMATALVWLAEHLEGGRLAEAVEGL